MTIGLNLIVNGTPHFVETAPWATLLEIIREKLLLTGSKEGCGVGECGTCMVLIDGAAVPSCLVLAPDAEGRRIETIEGVAAGGVLDEIQEAFVAAGAFQCGFCTPGMVVTAEALLRERPDAGDEEIKEALSGVLCRCGTYPRVVKAIGLARREAP